MNPLADIRRAFAANPHKVPLGERENAVLAARGIEQPTLRIYLAWRRSLMMFVVVTTLMSLGLMVYRAKTEPADDTDILETLAEYFAEEFGVEEEDDEEEETIALPGAMAGQAAASVGAKSAPKPPVPTDAAPPDEERTTFAKFSDGMEWAGYYALPVAGLALILFWTRFQLTFYILVAAFTFSFLIPMIVALFPWSWYGYIEANVTEKTNPLMFWRLKLEGILEGLEQLIKLLPTVLSLVPGVQRACIRVKLLLPQAMLPGFFLTAASPFYALFLLVIFVAINQFDTNWLFVSGFLLFLIAPLSYAVRSDLVTRPLATDDDYRRMKLLQRIVGLMTAAACALIVTFLTTREFRGIHLLGFDYEKSLLVPLDVVEFVLEVLSRSMFVTVLGADLFMRMNLKAWQHAKEFRGTPEAAHYDGVMSEFQRMA